jgi:hypothetical protein
VNQNLLEFNDLEEQKSDRVFENDCDDFNMGLRKIDFECANAGVTAHMQQKKS